ncbi:MAG: DUF2341 domain-containing protein [Candidatus Paceibacterota bacterium]|jgi:hypothetical protein
MPQIFRGKRLIMLFSIIIFLMVGGFCFWQFSPSNNVKGAVITDAWTHRKPITINTGSVVTSSVVKATVYYDEPMKNDFGDIRFVSVNGTIMDYWIESMVDGYSADVWIEIPSLVSGDNTIYMYYGNTEAVSLSSTANTFVFFEDFNSYNLGDLLGPTSWDGSGSNTVEVKDASKGKSYHQSGAATGVRSISSQGSSFVMEWDQLSSASPSFFGVYGSAFLSTYVSSSSNVECGSLDYPYSLNVWRHFKLEANYKESVYKIYIDSVPVNNNSPIAASSSFNRVISSIDISSGSVYYDNIRVYKSVDTATTISVGSEEIIAFSCAITSGACNGVGESVIFKMYSPDGGHAELSTQVNYSNKVCCKGGNGITVSNSCASTDPHATVLKLFDVSNSHVEENGGSYSNPVCISSATNPVVCSYTTSSAGCAALGSGYVCMAAMSDTNNAHVSACEGSSFTNPIYSCCKVGAIPFTDLIDCSSKPVSNPAIFSGGVDVQLCSGTDLSDQTNPASRDACYATCWKGIAGSAVVGSSNWKCSVCHDIDNNPVSCSTLDGTTYKWIMPGGYATPAHYTLISGTLASANPVVKFTTASNSRQLTLEITEVINTTCTGKSPKKGAPDWRELFQF